MLFLNNLLIAQQCSVPHKFYYTQPCSSRNTPRGGNHCLGEESRTENMAAQYIIRVVTQTGGGGNILLIFTSSPITSLGVAANKDFPSLYQFFDTHIMLQDSVHPHQIIAPHFSSYWYECLIFPNLASVALDKEKSAKCQIFIKQGTLLDFLNICPLTQHFDVLHNSMHEFNLQFL